MWDSIRGRSKIYWLISGAFSRFPLYLFICSSQAQMTNKKDAASIGAISKLGIKLVTSHQIKIHRNLIMEATITDKYGMRAALEQLGIKDINEGTSTGLKNF